MHRFRYPLFLSLIAALAAVAIHANSPPSTEAAAADMAAAAKNFWAALNPEQQAKAGFKFDDDERLNWHFIPKPRKGLPIKEMTSDQRELAHALLSSGVSHKGFSQAVTIMSLDAVLKEIEKGKGPVRDPENYFISIFGDPAGVEPWGWRFEGHHLSLNFTIANGAIAVAGPAFFGDNPGKILDGPRKGLRTLAAVEDAGRAVIKSLTDEQRMIAIVDATAPKDVISFNKRKAMLLDPVGLTYEKFTEEQKNLLTALVHEYADRLRSDMAADDLARIGAAGWDKVQFAWAGGIDLGQPHYYRVQGPTFLIEYDNTQNNANHVHSVWRDLQRDFGEDVLGKHLSNEKP